MSQCAVKLIVALYVDTAGSAFSIKDIDSDMLKIKDRIKHNIAPSAMGLFDVVTEELQDKEVIKIVVASGSEKPYFKKKYGMTEKGCFIRIGTAAEPLPQAKIDKFFASRTRNSIGKIKAHRQDLSFEQLRIYYEERSKPLNKQFKNNLELLTDTGDLNYAAYLLADDNGISIKVAKYADSTRVHLIESNEYGYCSLLKATKSVLDKVDTENTTHTQITSKERIEVRLWNAIALREAIVNAFVHNDYTHEVPPKFEIFPDRIEITYAGSLADGLSQAEFFDGYSIPRNKELMRVYKDLEMVEQLGTGVARITASYSSDCFKFTENFTRVTLPAAVMPEQQKRDGKELGKELSENQQKIIALIIQNPKITIKEMAEQLSLSETGIEKNIKKLREMGAVERVGGRRGGYWQYNEE